jgi:hypothetical protein
MLTILIHFWQAAVTKILFLLALVLVDWALDVLTHLSDVQGKQPMLEFECNV